MEILTSIFFFLIQMLAQDQSARDAESLVINNFNTKLVAKIASFKSNNTGVNSFFSVDRSYVCVCRVLNIP